MNPRIITIDGPAASGKSSVAREIARRLGWVYVNTGNMYRAATWAALRGAIDVSDEAAVALAAAGWGITCPVLDHRCVVHVDGRDIESELNSEAVNHAVSLVSCVPQVRDRLVAMQRAVGSENPVVMEGRDIGTVVFPDASIKFYINANQAVRARRRGLQGQTDSIGKRDQIDSTRKTAPLMPAADAVVVDSSELTLDEVVARVMDELQKRGFLSSIKASVSP